MQRIPYFYNSVTKKMFMNTYDRKGGAENAGPEIAGPENDGLNRGT